ncbi:MAG: glycosyltransferase family 4 protein [bacterium]|nr:glycosyltransferase family 4 protein [bacterium]
MPQPYHLCFVNSLRTWGGAEVWLLDTARELLSRGLQVSVVAQPDSELLTRVRAAGVPVAAIPIRFDTAPWTFWQLWRHLARAGVTAVITNRTKDLKAAGPAARAAGVGTILSLRESDFPLKDKLYYRWYFNRMATGLVVASEATRRTLQESAPWLDPDRIHLLPKGIDAERFHPADAPPNQPTVGFVGQLIDRKGLPEIMAAWTHVDAADRPDRPRLHLAGTGPLAADVERWRGTLQHPENVAVAGFVEDPAAFLRDLSVLLMPSHAEGFGLAAAEGSACGLPVIAARASSLPEIVIDGETGLLVPPGDAPALAAAINSLLDDPGLARTLGAAGRRRIQACFRPEDTLQRFLQLAGYQAGKGPAP